VLAVAVDGYAAGVVAAGVVAAPEYGVADEVLPGR
jgi:hypothetical protein